MSKASAVVGFGGGLAAQRAQQPLLLVVVLPMQKNLPLTNECCPSVVAQLNLGQQLPSVADERQCRLNWHGTDEVLAPPQQGRANRKGTRTEFRKM
ncbi:hypothetical protein niasHS_006466 [Heterodera schachtii]|uniref:Secreted protein n=1 Tax=Heterodera schachtii TaxID=97005 RepID=A0ABD2JHB3_HETSC